LEKGGAEGGGGNWEKLLIGNATTRQNQLKARHRFAGRNGDAPGDPTPRRGRINLKPGIASLAEMVTHPEIPRHDAAEST